MNGRRAARGAPPGGRIRRKRGHPPIWPLYLLYCVSMICAHAAIVALAALPLLFEPVDVMLGEATRSLLGTEAPVVHWLSVLLIAIAAPVGLLFVAAPFLPRKPWAWSVHLFLIGSGVSTVVLAPFLAPLLSSWLEPDTRAHFGLTPGPAGGGARG